MVIRRILISFVVVPAAALLAGCGDNYGGREAVSGTVTLKGEPLATGGIQFEPLDKQDTNGGSEIRDGQFTVAREFGLKPGKYLVRITAADGTTPFVSSAADAAAAGDAPGPSGGRPVKGNANILAADLIPADWSENSKQQVEVVAGKTNEFTFAIPNARETKKKK